MISLRLEKGYHLIMEHHNKRTSAIQLVTLISSTHTCCQGSREPSSLFHQVWKSHQGIRRTSRKVSLSAEPESGFKVCQIGIAIRNVVDYNCGNLAGLPPGWTSDIPKDRKLLPPTGFELPDRSSIITQELYPLFRV